MNIAIGSDHRGFKLKASVTEIIKNQGHKVIDVGAFNEEACDYPLVAHQVAGKVSSGEADRGVLICMSGNGMTIAANKVSGVRAALCHDVTSSALSRQHNDANVLTLSPGSMQDSAQEILDIWLKTDFEGGRHKRRVDQISDIEKQEKRK